MITQIEIDGFKTFKDFKVELAPFQVIVGANGSGKSNLFDALQLLGRLASYDLLEAFQELRGRASEQFTKVAEKTVLRRMHFAVEMLLDRLMPSETINSADLAYTRLRYEVEITHVINNLGPDQLFISYESLTSIPRKNDTWVVKHHVPSALLPGMLFDEGTPFIETHSRRALVVVNKVIGNLSAPKYSPGLEFSTKDLRRAVVSLVLGPEYLPIAAVREEMRAWRFLRLSPEELGKPSSAQGPRFLAPNGGNLPTMLAHMQLEDEFVLTDISRDMASLITDIYKVKVERNSARDEYDVWVETSDHRLFLSAVLSDGTLRLLALVAIKKDLISAFRTLQMF